jgi:hypothetical protein
MSADDYSGIRSGGDALQRLGFRLTAVGVTLAVSALMFVVLLVSAVFFLTLGWPD